MATFAAGEQRWIDQLGNLRNQVRQELVRRQLADHVRAPTVAPLSVLDVGCGQGTQSLHLLAAGHRVTAIDRSSELLARFRADAESIGVSPELLEGSVGDLDGLIGDRRFDLVCAHGLLMYFDGDEKAALVAALAARVAPGGRLSITFRNAHALAFRPGLRRDWPAALAAMTTDGDAYVNSLGVTASADRLEAITAMVEAAGLEREAWYGVRAFNDGVPSAMTRPEDEDWDALIEVEDRAGRQDPYRWLGSQLHLIATRTAPPA